jgi:hypothetical protein
VSAAIYTFAMYCAKKQLREQLRRHGVKLSSVSTRDLQILSQLWITVRSRSILGWSAKP